MAEIVTGVISTLLPKLGEVLKEEYQLQKTVRGEIMFLMAELERMQAALLEVSESEAATIDGDVPSKLVKLWARDVRELSYDVEDTIDRFMVRVGDDKPRSFRGFIDRSLNLLTKLKIRHEIGDSIRDIKSRAKEVSELRDRYKVDGIKVAKPVGQTVDNLRLQSALYRNVSDLVGTKKKTDDLVRRLMQRHGDEESKQKLKIVSIVGFGGVGKTTLANAVYQKLKGEFGCGAFVSISLSPNMVAIFKNMLRQLDEKNYWNINGETWEELQLIDELRKFLQNKRYIIVIDDIWSNSVWQTIKYALLDNKLGSRIITTTRAINVAEQVGGAYQLEPLSPDDSRNLFNQIIFHSKDKCPPHLTEISQNILKKCGGIPLAIITIASMLASKNGSEHEHWYKVYYSMGSGLEDSPDFRNMRRILLISYYDLLPHLKTCLLYLSLYPEDYLFTRDILIWKWLPPTFIQLKQLVYLLADHKTRLPDALGSLNRLQEIPNCIPINSSNMLHDLGGLSKLRHLAIYFDKWDESYEKAFLSCLSNLISLKILVVKGKLGSTCGNLSREPQLLHTIDMSCCTLTAVPRWMLSLSLSSLDITLLTLGEEILKVLGSIPSLNDLKIRVKKSTHGRNKRLLISNVYPFPCLTQFRVDSNTMEVGFAQGAMEKLRDLTLHFEVSETMDQFGDFDSGLENLSSLEHVTVCIHYSNPKLREADGAMMAIRRSLDMNPNNPTVELYKV
uniref:AAA+ ATPase domain-containing protein n=1 Tax=Leersia perrieri TaxID=77586 RepID=A0A0D9XT12_9ORYZ